MHIPAKFVLFGLLPLAICSCQSVSDQIIRSFVKVNESIERSNKVLLASDSLAYYHRSIDAKAANDTTRKADSLYEATLHVVKFIDLAKDLLCSRDPFGDSTQVAATVLIGTPIGDSLHNALKRLGFLSLANAGGKPLPDEAFEDSARIDNPHWAESFAGKPTIMVITFLNSTEGQCTKNTITLLSKVNAELKRP